MELIVSGYGAKPTNDLALYSINSSGNSKMTWEISLEDPSFICEGDGYLFAVTEARDYAYIHLLERYGNGVLQLDQMRIDGGYLCHITYSSKHKALFGACYETGTVFSVRVEEDRFGEILFHEIQQGDDPNAVTRAHMVLLNREETILVTVNISLDRIYYYDIREGNLSLSHVLQLPQGIGPRHALYSTDEKLLYIITEYSNEILVYAADGSSLFQRISTLEVDYTGISNCSTLCFSKDHRFLYAANRGAQTITLFQLSGDGALIRLREFDCGGRHPRHMIVTQDGRFLAVCNQNSDNIAVFELDSEDGALKKLIASIPFPAPSGIVENVENRA